MITIETIEFRTDNNGIKQIQERVARNTCKTNLNPQLMFKQSYTGLTGKIFVGNWTDNGFWISKFRHQLFQLRPDIITRFSFESGTSYEKVKMKSSIGFSSLFFGILWIILFSIPFATVGQTGFFIGVVMMLILYSFLTSIEYNRMIKAIKDNIVNGIYRSKSRLD